MPVSARDAQVVSLLQHLVGIVNQMVEIARQSQVGAMYAGAGAAGAPTTVAGAAVDSFHGADATKSGAKASFQIASFNLLGSSHTAASGNKPQYRSGTSRAPDAVKYLDKHGVDVAGLQEFQGDQQQAFKRLKPGWKLSAQRDNAIAWDNSKFKLVKEQSVTIPYFEGSPRKMPVVLLEDRATGKRMWMVNIHNPANTKDHPNNEANRDKATKIEQDLIKRLSSDGTPVFLVGDFNEKAEAHDKITSVANTSSAAPKQAKTGIDWIFGTGAIEFSDYAFEQGTQKSKTSDHPLVVSTATI